MSKTATLISAPALARSLGITDRTVYNWGKSGILPAPIRINGRKYFRADTHPKFDDDAPEIGSMRPKVTA
jgi:predicted site-specific integrase-resolvase